jgi:hypothetical protein
VRLPGLSRGFLVSFAEPGAIAPVLIPLDTDPDRSAVLDRHQRATPDTGGRGFACVVGEVSWLSAERAPDAVRRRRSRSLGSFLWLRRHYGLSLRRTRETITELALTFLRS